MGWGAVGWNDEGAPQPPLGGGEGVGRGRAGKIEGNEGTENKKISLSKVCIPGDTRFGEIVPQCRRGPLSSGKKGELLTR
jgi:hypothetical protein